MHLRSPDEIRGLLLQVSPDFIRATVASDLALGGGGARGAPYTIIL
jgi:hypothetical protein